MFHLFQIRCWRKTVLYTQCKAKNRIRGYNTISNLNLFSITSYLILPCFKLKLNTKFLLLYTLFCLLLFTLYHCVLRTYRMQVMDQKQLISLTMICLSELEDMRAENKYTLIFNLFITFTNYIAIIFLKLVILKAVKIRFISRNNLS